MQVLIVEDEALMARQLQKTLLRAEPAAAVAATTHSVEETVAWLQHHPPPDLVLMDIELADGQSFDIFEKVTVGAPVIFVTAYDEYAIKAFKVNSIDYLLKPVKEEELTAALHKFKNMQHRQPVHNNIEALLAGIKKLQEPVAYRDRFLVKKGQKMISIDVDAIAYIFSDNGFSFLRTEDNGKYIIDYTLDQLEGALPPRQFFRASRGYILSHKCIAAVHPWFNQKLKVEVKPATEEPVVVSRDKAGVFREWMGE